jgi:DNA replication protein DnaC
MVMVHFKKNMRPIEYTFKNAEFLQPKVYNRYKLGTREELKEDFVKAFKHYDKTIVEYKHLSAYDEIIDWMVDTKGKGLILMGECGLGKSTILKSVIPAIFNTIKNKVLRCVPALFCYWFEYKHLRFIYR